MPGKSQKLLQILLQMSSHFSLPTARHLVPQFWSPQPRRLPHSLHSPAPYAGNRRRLHPMPQRLVALAGILETLQMKCVWMK